MTEPIGPGTTGPTAGAGAGVPSSIGGARPEFAGAVGRLTLVNIAVASLGVVSGAVQARGLGPQRRGELAAIVVPLLFLSLVGDFGLAVYLRRETARATSLGPLVGTVAALVVTLGLVMGAGLYPVIDLVAKDRAVVEQWLGIGLILLPLNLFGSVLLNAAFGLGRWDLWARSRLILSLGWVLALSALYATGHLSVASAAASMAVITVLSNWPLLAVLPGARPLSLDRRIARQAVPFASRAWVAGLTNVFNLRLDQLLMVALVDSRELGLYAVAVTFAGVPGTISSAVGLAILPRVARDGSAVVPRAVRMALIAVLLTGVAMALVSWPLVHFVIGDRYGDALPMIWLLLVAEIPLAGSITLSQAFIGAGRPGQAALAEGLALVVGAIGLLLALPVLGGVGAALVSVSSYSLSFGYLLVRGAGTFASPVRSFVLPTAADLTSTARELRRVLAFAKVRRGSRSGE